MHKRSPYHIPRARQDRRDYVTGIICLAVVVLVMSGYLAGALWVDCSMKLRAVASLCKAIGF